MFGDPQFSPPRLRDPPISRGGDGRSPDLPSQVWSLPAACSTCCHRRARQRRQQVDSGWCGLAACSCSRAPSPRGCDGAWNGCNRQVVGQQCTLGDIWHDLPTSDIADRCAHTAADGHAASHAATNTLAIATHSPCPLTAGCAVSPWTLLTFMREQASTAALLLEKGTNRELLSSTKQQAQGIAEPN